jgi:large subunit ribosomal protein L10
MKKIGLVIKETSEHAVKNRLSESPSMFIIKYSGVSSPDMSALRRSLRSSRASLVVVKNSVARRALKAAGRETLIASVEGPCGMVFCREEPVAASKVLFDFLKTHEALKIGGGYLLDKTLTTRDVENLSKLPSRETLIAQAVMAINAPRVKFVMTLNTMLRKLVVCLDQIKSKK